MVTSAIDIDSNGRILRGGTGSSNFTEAVNELLLGNASICPFWTDLNPAVGDDVYFNALPGLALITWQDMQLFGGSAPFTFQCQLRPDDSIVFVFDDRVPSDSAIVGLSAGGGVANPGSSNLGAASASTSVDAIYELFGNFDLFSVSIGFARNGSGWRSMSGVSGFPVRASVAPFGRSCRSAFDLTPVASGGYAVSVSQRFVTDFGVSLGISGNDAVVGPVALAFPFAMPGGSFVTTISVDSNGRILPPGADPSDPTPRVAELLNESHATIAPFWTDLDLTVLGGDVRFASTPSSATVTWENIAQAGGADPLTVQATLRADGSMTFAYFDTTDFDVELRDVIVGVSPGSVAVDPGSRDWSIGFFSGGSTVYEWFTMGGAKLDLQLSVTALSTSLQGQSFDVQLDGVPAGSAAGLLLIGFVPIEAPLDRKHPIAPIWFESP